MNETLLYWIALFLIIPVVIAFSYYRYRVYNCRKVYDLILAFFEGDKKKTVEWFRTVNPNLGATPARMIEEGREAKLLKWMERQLDENRRI